MGGIETVTARAEEKWGIGKGNSLCQKYGDHPGKCVMPLYPLSQRMFGMSLFGGYVKLISIALLDVCDYVTTRGTVS